MPQESGQPFTIPHVGLAPGHRLDRPGVDQDDRQAPFQAVEHRLPIDPRALARDMHTVPRRQPIRQLEQIVGHRRERPALRLPRADPTRHHGLGRHVQPTTARIQDFPMSLLSSGRENLACERVRYACSSPSEGNRRGYLRGSRVRLTTGLRAPRLLDLGYAPDGGQYTVPLHPFHRRG